MFPPACYLPSLERRLISTQDFHRFPRVFDFADQLYWEKKFHFSSCESVSSSWSSSVDKAANIPVTRLPSSFSTVWGESRSELFTSRKSRSDESLSSEADASVASSSESQMVDPSSSSEIHMPRPSPMPKSSIIVWPSDRVSPLGEGRNDHLNFPSANALRTWPYVRVHLFLHGE